MAEAMTAFVAASNADSEDESSSNFNATQALINYLRTEADLADEKAKRLRRQAATLAQQFGVSNRAQAAFEVDPNQLPPLDENGVPKYKGKKRGRKPKPRKRKTNPNRRKRQHTGYTLFMQENYPTIKDANTELPSKDIIAMVAKQWAELLPAEKTEWKSRALATHNEDGEEGEMAAAAAAAASVEDVDEDEEDVDEDEEFPDDDEPAPPARRKTKRVKK